MSKTNDLLNAIKRYVEDKFKPANERLDLLELQLQTRSVGALDAILPMIEADKLYPRGTLAKHNGGIVRAYKNTSTLGDGGIEPAGWEVLVNGVSDLVVGVNERDVVIKSVMTDGRINEQQVRMPMMLYRGVWSGKTYEQGDTVSFGGSLWHCEKQTEAKPGESEDWKLAVKKGRDGKATATDWKG